MNNKKIAVITIIIAAAFVLFFIFLRIINITKSPDDSSEFIEESTPETQSQNIESVNSASTELIIETTPPTFYGKPIETEGTTEAPSETKAVSPLENEVVEIKINGMNVNDFSVLKDLYSLGYTIDKGLEKKKLSYDDIDNPILKNKNDENDSLFIVIRNKETVPVLYSECQIERIMIDLTNCSPNIIVGNYDLNSLSADDLFQFFGSPKTYFTDDSVTYISYQASNLQFDFEFKNDDQCISLGINYIL